MFLSCFFFCSFSASCYLSLSFSLSHTQTHTHTHTHTQSLPRFIQSRCAGMWTLKGAVTKPLDRRTHTQYTHTCTRACAHTQASIHTHTHTHTQSAAPVPVQFFLSLFRSLPPPLSSSASLIPHRLVSLSSRLYSPSHKQFNTAASTNNRGDAQHTVQLNTWYNFHWSHSSCRALFGLGLSKSDDLMLSDSVTYKLLQTSIYCIYPLLSDSPSLPTCRHACFICISPLAPPHS